MILIALGANLPSRYGDPEDTLYAAVEALKEVGLDVVSTSSVWSTAPVPVSDQPWYRNAVVSVQTSLNVHALMQCLQKVELNFGRVRSVKDAPRVIDLDIIAYHDEIYSDVDCMIPHPRMHLRAFVLMPLQEIAPGWLHPVSGMSVQKMIDSMPEGQEIEISKNRAA